MIKSWGLLPNQWLNSLTHCWFQFLNRLLGSGNCRSLETVSGVLSGSPPVTVSFASWLPWLTSCVPHSMAAIMFSITMGSESTSYTERPLKSSAKINLSPWSSSLRNLITISKKTHCHSKPVPLIRQFLSLNPFYPMDSFCLLKPSESSNRNIQPCLNCRGRWVWKSLLTLNFAYSLYFLIQSYFSV